MTNKTNLNIGLIYDPIMATDCATNPRCQYPGAAVEAARIVCEYLRVKCTFSWPSDRNEYGRMVKGKWIGMIGDVASGRFDTAIPYFFPTFERWKILDFSSFYFVVDQVFVTRMPDPNRIPRLDFTMIFAFTWQVWLCFFSCCLLMGLSISIFETDRSNRFDQNRLSRLCIVMFEASKYLSGNSDSYKPFRRIGSNLMFAWWGLLSLVLSGTYTGVLFSRQVASKNELPFTDTSTFIKCIQSGECRFVYSSRQDYLFDRLISSNNNDSRLLQEAFEIHKPLIVPESELWTRIRSDNRTYWTTIDVRAFFYANTEYNDRCSYYVVEAPFHDIAGFPLRKRSALKRKFDSAARVFRDHGFNLALSKKYQKTAEQCRPYQQQQTASSLTNTVPLYLIRSFFVLYAIGIIVAFMIFIVEIRRKHSNRSQRTTLSIKRKILKQVHKNCCGTAKFE